MQNTSLVRARSLPKDRSLARYLEQIRTFEVLTLEEEQKLFLRYRDDGDKAAGERLILSNLHTVVKVARRYYSQFASFFDLIQEGNVGLMQAIDRYDPTKGVPYSTYARYWIRAMILKYVMDNHRLVKVGGTRSGRRMFFELNRERNRLLQLGEEASPQVLSQQLGIDVEEVEAVAAALAPEEWIDAPREGHSWHDTMQAPNSDPEDLVSRGNLAQVLRGALDTFSETVTCEREQTLMRERLLADEPASLAALGRQYGVSRERMRQLESRLKKRLRTFLVDELGADLEVMSDV